jgi:von Willebrand factor A domain-containing protein 8
MKGKNKHSTRSFNTGGFATENMNSFPSCRILVQTSAESWMLPRRNRRIQQHPLMRRRTMAAMRLDEDDVKPFRRIGLNFIRCGVVEREVTDIEKLSALQRRKIPTGYLAGFSDDVVGQARLRWMLQKDALIQDPLLISSGGAGLVQCRRLAMAYAELVQRPVEVLTIESNTNVSDILQRLVEENGGGGHNAHDNVHTKRFVWEDQATVRAALQGHVLILDGLHRAERNVISALNNLLSNRELSLEDGRSLVSTKRYKYLREEVWGKGKRNSLISPIREDFRVIALWSRNLDRLDPSVRSRFQVCRVDTPPSGMLYENLMKSHGDNESKTTMNEKKDVASLAFAIPNNSRDVEIPDVSIEKSAEQLAIIASVLTDTQLIKNAGFYFPLSTVPSIHLIQRYFPKTPLTDLLCRSFPYASSESRLHKVLDLWPMAVSTRKLVRLACQEIGLPLVETPTDTIAGAYEFNRVEAIPGDPHNVITYFSQRKMFNKQGIFASMFKDYSLGDVKVQVASGGNLSTSKQSSSTFIPSKESNEVLTAMFQEHFAGRDILLVSPRGEGKSAIANHFCTLTGYDVCLFPLHQDITVNDLFRREASKTVNNKQIKTRESPLLRAARTGQVCILDGIEKLAPDIMATLQGFLTDREVVLPDGTKYQQVAPGHESDQNGIQQVHQSFRVIALASISATGIFNHAPPPTWLSEEVVSMFATIPLPAASRECCNAILKHHNKMFSSSDLYKLYSFYEKMSEVAYDCGISPFSIRSMVRFVKRGNIPDITDGKGSLPNCLRSMFLSTTLKNSQRYVLEYVLLLAEIEGEVLSLQQRRKRRELEEKLKIEVVGDVAKIGKITLTRLQPKSVDLVPDPIVSESPDRVILIQLLLNEWARGERTFLLIANPNTGIRHFCDGVCGLINHEREYVNLNQRWTIDQLATASQSDNGRYDSPLVRAMMNGRSVVIDGVDDAAFEIRALLKALADDGEMLLSDGRRILKDKYKGDKSTFALLSVVRLKSKQ